MVAMPPHAPRPPLHVPPLTVIGLMSGTSADGIDAAVVRLSGAPPTLSWELLAYLEVEHAAVQRQAIFDAFRPETSSADLLCRLNFELGRAFADAALSAIDAAGLRPDQVDLIGSHGQTVWHLPEGPQASTLQLGEAAVIAERTGITTVSNFRTRDMAAGGQGAPLVAYVDALLLSHATRARAVQNIGGIANVTYLPASNGVGESIAFDTGPGNMLIDTIVTRLTDGASTYDMDGEMAAAGSIHEGLLAELMAEPYLVGMPPKTTGRELFGVQYAAQIWHRAQELGLSGVDQIATVTAYTAQSITRAYRDFLPALPKDVIVSGGGAANPTLMRMLAQALPESVVCLSDDLGLPADAKEAIAFAVLAYETWHGRPGNLPSVIGASRPVVLGSITPGRAGDV